MPNASNTKHYFSSESSPNANALTPLGLNTSANIFREFTKCHEGCHPLGPWPPSGSPMSPGVGGAGLVIKPSLSVGYCLSFVHLQDAYLILITMQVWDVDRLIRARNPGASFTTTERPNTTWGTLRSITYNPLFQVISIYKSQMKRIIMILSCFTCQAGEQVGAVSSVEEASLVRR